MVTVEDIMSKDVFKIEKSENVYAAVNMMSMNTVSCLVVIDNGKGAGIITRRDVLEKVVLPRKNVDEVKVEEIMSTPVITMAANATLIAASGIMNAKKIKQIPIVNNDDLIGIITQTDIVLNINNVVQSFSMSAKVSEDTTTEKNEQ